MRGLYTVSLVILFGSLFLPLGVFKVVIAAVVLFVYPGILLGQYLVKDSSKALFISPVVGASLWVVLFYILSVIDCIRVEPVIVLSLISAVLLDIKGEYPRPQKWMLPLFVCMIFSSLYFYPWNTSLIPPFDDAKYHSFFVVAIENAHHLPHDYGIYEIPHLTYPLGYHTLLAVTKDVSGQPIFPVVTLTTWVLLLCAPACFYIFSLPFNKKGAVLTAFSFSFLSIFFHRLEQTATYPNLLAIEIMVLSLYALQSVLKDFSFKKAVIISLLMASAVEVHIYALLIYVPFFMLYGLYLFTQRRSLNLLFIVFIAGVFALPYAFQFNLHTPHQEELSHLREWYNKDALTSTESLSTTLSSMSPVLIVLSLVSLPLFTRKDIFLGLLLISLLIIPFLSVFEIEYPGWYAVTCNRFFHFTFIPLCVFSAKGICRLNSVVGKKNMLILVTLGLLLHFTDVFYPWSKTPGVDEINPPEDIDVIYFMKTLPPDSVILNYSAHSHPSGWIPSIAGKKVFLPPFSFNRSDGCIYYLKSPERLSDLSLYAYPHSPDALSFLKKYSIDYVFVTSLDKVDVRDFSTSFYRLVYRKKDSYLFKVDIIHVEENIIIVGGPRAVYVTDAVNQAFGITYTYKPEDTFEIQCEGASIVLDLDKYPLEDICIVYIGEYNQKKTMLIWGYGQEGTKAGVLFAGDPEMWQPFKNARMLMLRWRDGNNDSTVQVSEVTVESKKGYQSGVVHIASREDAVRLADQFLRDNLGEFFDNHFTYQYTDEREDLRWAVVYTYTYNGYCVLMSVGIDTGLLPQYTSRIDPQLTAAIQEPQKILLSKEEAVAIAQEYGVEPPYTILLSFEPLLNRICWKIVKDAENGAVLLIDAENGAVLTIEEV